LIHRNGPGGDFNAWILNQVLAPNPYVRYLTSLMYLSGVNGLSRINYPDSSFMKSIKFDKLLGHDKPLIFHNAFDLDNRELAFFDNDKLKPELRARDASTHPRYARVRRFRLSNKP
jgi:hypothetical protein